MKDIDDEVLFKLVKYHLNKIYHKRKDKIIHAGTGLTQPAQWYRDFAQAVIDVALKDLVMDVRCEGCGYMTHHREHMGCVRAAKQHTHPAPSVPDEKPLPDLMMASYHEAIGWNACRAAMLAAKDANP